MQLEEQSSRPLPSDIEDDDIWECESVTVSFKEELPSPTLVENKDNEITIEEKPLLENMQVEE